MQVTQTVEEGLKREFQVTVPAADLEAKVKERLDELKNRVQIRGFRPGKVPVDHLKKLYGRAAMAEVIEAAVRDANSKIVSDHGIRLATEPKVTLPSDQAEVEKVLTGESDLSYSVAVEVIPPITLTDFKGIKLERLSTKATDAEIDAAVQQIANQNRPFSPKPDGSTAEKDDRVTISFTGRIDGTVFEGGTGTDVAVHLGSGTFIPGFEDQLVGIAAGETRTVKVTFPKNYMNEQLAGKDAEFEVTASSIETPGAVNIDDEFAKGLGMESLAKLRDAVKERLEKEYATASRQKLKRRLLDELDKRHPFEPPPSLVENEFENIWRSVKQDLDNQNRTFADENTTEEAAREEYRAIAERRVRLGLVLAEIGDKNNIKVADEEVSRAVVEQVRQFPGREKQVWDYYRNNPDALASVRAPIFEEKVVDFLLELAQVTDKPVSREELYKEEEEKAEKTETT
jgi:trigger factor